LNMQVRRHGDRGMFTSPSSVFRSSFPLTGNNRVRMKPTNNLA
jgi:hypothetical protein